MSTHGTGRKWAVTVSAAILAMVAMSAAVAYAARDGGKDPATPPSDVAEDPQYETISQPAPIEDVRVEVEESMPPQYVLQVVSSLPTGCDRFEGYDVNKDGTDIIATVTNRVPSPEALPTVLCAMGMTSTWSTIRLGSDFTSGETYRVIVNGEVADEFTAQ
jgi:hypothetical protein